MAPEWIRFRLICSLYARDLHKRRRSAPTSRWDTARSGLQEKINESEAMPSLLRAIGRREGQRPNHFLDRDESQLDALDDRGDAVTHAQLFDRVREVKLHSLFGDRQYLADFPIGLSFLAPAQTFRFLERQRFHGFRWVALQFA